jgi:cytochrome c5
LRCRWESTGFWGSGRRPVPAEDFSNMSDKAHSHDEHEAPHEGPVKTPKQLVLAVLFSFLVPIIGILLLVNFVASGPKSGAGSQAFTEEAVAARIQPIGTVELRDASAPRVLRAGQEVYKAQCAVCHDAGVAGAPKFGDAGAWAPRIATGYEALLNSALKGKGAMGAQGGGEFSDLEIGRAVVYMANNAGGKLPEPQAPAAEAAASQ